MIWTGFANTSARLFKLCTFDFFEGGRPIKIKQKIRAIQNFIEKERIESKSLSKKMLQMNAFRGERKRGTDSITNQNIKHIF